MSKYYKDILKCALMYYTASSFIVNLVLSCPGKLDLFINKWPSPRQTQNGFCYRRANSTQRQLTDESYGNLWLALWGLHTSYDPRRDPKKGFPLTEKHFIVEIFRLISFELRPSE
jgi:hypothetical protein